MVIRGRSRSALAVAAFLALLAVCSIDALSFSVADAGSTIADAEAKAGSMLTSLQHGVGGVLVITSMILVRLIVKIIPGLAVLLLGWAGYRIYSTGSYNARTFLGLAMALGLTYGLILVGEKTQSPESLAPANAVDSQGQGVRSGELVLMQNGEVVLRPDPRVTAGPAEPGWQEALAQSIQMALVQGQEQVVLEFSRRGCTYCAKQLPVLQEVMRGRAAAGSSLAMGTAFVGGSLGLAPLRVFLLDAEEFPQLAQGFQVQAFPTLWIFGKPKVDPIVTQGFLEKPKLEEILQIEAMKRPPAEKRKGPLARLFR